MADVSYVERIVDSAAYIGSLVAGVKTVFGCGSSGLVFPPNPVVPDGKIRPFTGLPPEAQTFVADLPGGVFTAHSATWTDLQWSIPLCLYLDVNDQSNARVIGMRFVPRIVAAFAAHSLLETAVSGIVNPALLRDVRWAADEQKTWFRLEMTLQAIERLNLDYQAG